LRQGGVELAEVEPASHVRLHVANEQFLHHNCLLRNILT
jgi:hypothetical protein